MLACCSRQVLVPIFMKLLMWTIDLSFISLKFLHRFQKTNGIILIAATNRKDVLDP